MKSLLLIRHAKSSWDNPGLRDFDRPLNGRGLHEGPLMASLVRMRGVRPDLLVSSPAKRAMATARFFAVANEIPEEDIVREPGIYEAGVREILQIVSALPDSARTVFLFGHNPTFTDVSNRYADDFIENVPTCGVIHLESSADSWMEMCELNTRLRVCLFPREVL
jgi:phosphohistidine phosphatase